MSVLRHLVKNKKVIFVGPSPHLLGEGLSSWIDSFDTVIRTNGAWALPKMYPNDFGHRTDILYTNIQHSREYENRSLPVSTYRGLGIKLLKIKTSDQDRIHKYSEFMPTEGILSRHPTNLMGVLISEEIRVLRPKEFWITGVDFYVNGAIESYVDGYQGKKIQERIDKKIISEPRHNLKLANRYFLNQHRSGFLNLDSTTLGYLKQAFSMGQN